MKKTQIKVGGHYEARVSGHLVTVRVDEIKDWGAPSVGSGTRYHVTNLRTGRKTVFRSAAKFRNPAGETPLETARRKAKESADEKFDRAAAATVAHNRRQELEDEQLPDPTSGGPPATSAAVPSHSAPSALVDRLAAVDQQADDSPHLIVEARAGTGKTTTLVEGLKRVVGLGSVLTPSPQQAMVWDCMELSAGKAKSICFVAFNRSIAAELKQRVPPGCEAMTMHGMGLRAVCNAFKLFGKEGGVNEWRVREIIGELMGRDPRDLQREQPVLVKATGELVGLCKMNLCDGDSDQLDQIAGHYEVELNGQRDKVFALVPGVLERCKRVDLDGCVDYDDMIWLPVVLGLPVRKYDLLLVDECLPGWTPVMLADGRSMTIKEVVESNEEIRVRSYDTSRGVGKNCLVTGRQRILNQKPLVKVAVRHHHRTGTNRKRNFVVCTIDHNVWTVNRGWVEAGQLQVGDNVIVETAARTTQKGKITGAGRGHLSEIQKGNRRGLGSSGGDPTMFNSNKGGNGRGPTLAEQTLLEALGTGWVWNHIVLTGDAPQFGRGDKPSHYKLDLADPKRKIAVEVDGRSHQSEESRRKDRKKQQFLETTGWTVFRVTNQMAIQNSSEVVCEITGNCPRPARVTSVKPVVVKDPYVYDITVEDCHNFYANGILVHNCQDLNRCQQALAKAAGKRLVLCGDPRQAIYGFAGADAESMKRMEQELGQDRRGCVKLYLTVTRRCGKAIVAEARKIVPDFEAFPENGVGGVSQAKFGCGESSKVLHPGATYHTSVQDGDFILCRVNAPLVSECFRFIKAGRKANIQGRDVGKGLVKLVEKLGVKDVAGVITALGDWLDNEQRKEMAKKFPSESRMIALQDKHDCLLCFTDGLGSGELPAAVTRRIESVFTDDKQAQGIRLSSIHKAKGLEAKRVFLLEPEGATVPHPMSKSSWQLAQEWNLRYVAITRAIEELVFVS